MGKRGMKPLPEEERLRRRKISLLKSLAKRKERYHNDEEYRAKTLASNRSWQSRNHDKYLEYQREYLKTYVPTDKNKEQVRLSNRAESVKAKKLCKEEANYTCERCGSVENIEAHHIVPIRLGLDNSKENLVCLCRDCHRRIDAAIRSLDDVEEIMAVTEDYVRNTMRNAQSAVFVLYNQVENDEVR